MRLIFTKGGGKQDDLRIERDGLPPQSITCPKQGILPHDMVHYAVEGVLAYSGFLAMVAEGENAAFVMRADDGEEAVERLVESIQAEMWGGREEITDLIATYEHACEAHGHAAMPVSSDDVAAIREKLDALTMQWEAVPVGGQLTLDF